MSSYDEPSTGHRNAVQQVSDARQQALRAVSEMQQRGVSSHPPNLAPGDKGEKSDASVAAQAVADYLLQLRPYRATTSSWEVELGAVTLPEQIGGGSQEVFAEPAPSNTLHICRDPTIPLRNVSQLIQATNMSVQYSTKTTGPSGYRPPRLVRQTTTQNNNKAVRGDPNIANTAGHHPSATNHEVRTYNLVFPSQTLLRFLELADEVAAEMNLLIEFDTPSEQDTGGF